MRGANSLLKQGDGRVPRRRTRLRILRAMRYILPPRQTARARSTLSEGSWTAGLFRSTYGCLAYRVHVPPGYNGQPVPLLVMLHGCGQNPEDFAAATRMNALADEHTFLVLYPAQSAAANRNHCWNWFEATHQQRDQAEPALLAGVTRRIIRRYAVDPARVY